MADVPVLPVFYDMAITQEGKRMSNEAMLYNDNLWQSLNALVELVNTFISYNGISVPQFTTAEITALAVTAPNGTFWYDTDTNQIKAKSNGVVVVVV